MQELVEEGGEAVLGGQYVLLELERCVPVVPGAVLIGSRFFLAPTGALCVLTMRTKASFCIFTQLNPTKSQQLI